jgi:hypothetical protein
MLFSIFRPIRRRSRLAPVEVRVRKAESIPMRGCGQVGVVSLTLGSLGINTAVSVFCHKIAIYIATMLNFVQQLAEILQEATSPTWLVFLAP